jgi:hypothetical protein
MFLTFSVKVHILNPFFPSFILAWSASAMVHDMAKKLAPPQRHTTHRNENYIEISKAGKKQAHFPLPMTWRINVVIIHSAYNSHRALGFTGNLIKI